MTAWPVASPPLPRSSGADVLVVDDNREMQVLIERILVREGHRIVLAANGREGLRALKSGPFELVLTDLFMPDMDGIELVDREEGLEAENGNGSEVVDKHRVLPVKAVPRSEALQNTIGVAAGAAR